MSVMKKRKFTVTTEDGKTVQVNRSPERLYLDGLPVAFITPDVSGTVHVFTGHTNWPIVMLHRYVFSGATFWDILYDVPPTKDLAGQLQALVKSV